MRWCLTGSSGRAIVKKMLNHPQLDLVFQALADPTRRDMVERLGRGPASLSALLNETLIERFNEDWWRNPKAGPWMIAELLEVGQRELAQELAKRVANAPLGFAPLVRRIERDLA